MTESNKIPTSYLIPHRAYPSLSVEEANFFSCEGILNQYIEEPELFTEDGNPPAGGIIPLILAFDKPLGMTSFQLVARVRWVLSKALKKRKIKIGHAGTLDPLATGVMVLCLGKATKQIEEMQAGVKQYEATLKLGATTPSFDLEHPVDHTFPTDHITQERIEEVLKQFTGEIKQVPPAFSACKVEGKRAYDLARSGKDVQLSAKPVTIHELELVCYDPETQQLKLRVTCSKGTYIRSLARDIGTALDSGAHLTALRRTQVGPFTIDRCFTLDEFDLLYKPSKPQA